MNIYVIIMYEFRKETKIINVVKRICDAFEEAIMLI